MGRPTSSFKGLSFKGFEGKILSGDLKKVISLSAKLRYIILIVPFNAKFTDGVVI